MTDEVLPHASEVSPVPVIEPADESRPTLDDVTDSTRRADRYEQNRRSRRMWFLGAIVALAAVVALVAWGVVWFYVNRLTAPPERVLIIAETTLEDGAVIAGPVVVLDKSEKGFETVPVDTSEPVAIPGTSYDRLADALPMGGPELLAEIVLGKEADTAGWVVLSQDAWADVIDAAGGADVSVPGTTTVFTGDKLVRFQQGLKKLSGDEAVALSLGAESFEGVGAAARVRMELAERLGEAVIASPDRLIALVKSGAATSSEQPDVLSTYLGGQ